MKKILCMLLAALMVASLMATGVPMWSFPPPYLLWEIETRKCLIVDVPVIAIT